MIEFTTLFLALVLGQQSVEVAVGPSVRVVELRLDGRLVASLEGPPWRAEVDFGEDLLPHDLVATALSESGQPLGEARQWVNFGRGLVEARIAFEGGQSWPPRWARVYWQSFDGSAPVKTEVRFDGQPVEVSEVGRILLPGYDPDSPHSLEAQLRFAGNLDATAAISFGGLFGERLSSDLTAIPLFFSGEKPNSAAAEMASWFEAQGKQLRVFSASREGETIYVVRDQNLPKRLNLPAGSEILGSTSSRQNRPSNSELFFLATSPKYQGSGAAETAIFKPYKVYSAWRRKGLAHALARQRGPRLQDDGQGQRIFDAAAVAGKLAAQSGGARAVVLLMDSATFDQSRLGLWEVATYMKSLRVPFFVWLRTPEPRSLEPTGEALVETNLTRAANLVAESLASQMTVWLEGRYLPEQIELAEGAPGNLRLVP